MLYRRGSTKVADLVAVVNSNPKVDDGRLEEVDVALPIPRGEESYVLSNLSAGDYVAVCFINQGVTSLEGIRRAAAGTPDHRSLGMVRQFSVG